MQHHDAQGADLAKRLVVIGTADACSAQSQCLHHHIKALLVCAALLPDTTPKNLSGKLFALKENHKIVPQNLTCQ